MGDGRKRTCFQSLQYENNTNALTGGRTDGLNADVAVMRTGYEPVSTKEGRGRNWAGEGDQNLQINLRFQCLHIFLHFLNEKPKLRQCCQLTTVN